MPDQAGVVTAVGGDTIVVHPDGSYDTAVGGGSSVPFNFGDTLVTGSGHARGVMGDASVLNVGANASLQVLPHDSAPARTWLQQIYGNFRSWFVGVFGPDSGGGGGGGGGTVGSIKIGISSNFGDDMYGDLEWDNWMT